MDKNTRHDAIKSTVSDENHPNTSYRDIVLSSEEKEIHQVSNVRRNINEKSTNTKEKEKSKKRNNNGAVYQENMELDIEISHESNATEALEKDEEENNKSKISYFKLLLKKLKIIILSKTNFENKVFAVMKLLIAEVRKYFVDIMMETDCLNSIFNIFKNG